MCVMNPCVNVFEMALATLPAIGKVVARLLIQQFGSAEEVFRASMKELERTEGVGCRRAGIIKGFTDFRKMAAIIESLERKNISTLFLTHPAYPRRLTHCYDPPTILYFRGNCDLNAARAISIIGTRNHTRYGKQLTEQLVQDLARQQVLVISGLAYGIDGIAHQEALRHGLNTVAVMASGPDVIYPSEHYELSKRILNGGGLLTEFGPGIQPEKHHFPSRNRIVAGMADATIVVETGEKGGSIITAELAQGYHRDVFAFPGRIHDEKSRGCNMLIARQTAQLIHSAEDVIRCMSWDISEKMTAPVQPSFFPEMDEQELSVTAILKEKGIVHADVVGGFANMSAGKVSAVLLQLEMKGIVVSLPGKTYKLSGP